MYFTKKNCLSVLFFAFTCFSIVACQHIPAGKEYGEPKDVIRGASATAKKIAAGDSVRVYVRISEYDLRKDRKLTVDEIAKAKDVLKGKMQSVGVRLIEEEESQPVLKMMLTEQAQLEALLADPNVASLAYPGMWQGIWAAECSYYPDHIVNGLMNPETSDYAPDFAFFKGKHYVAWTGRDTRNGGKHLNLQTSSFYWPNDGYISWGSKKTFYNPPKEARSEDGPKLLATEDRLWIAWRSVKRKRIFLMNSTNGMYWQPSGAARRITYQGNYQTSDYAPAMASFKNEYYIAWTGRDTQNGGKHLNVMRGDLSSAGTQINWSTKITFYSGPTQAQSDASPGLLGIAERLYVVWRGRDDHKIRYMHTTDGTTWQGKTRLNIRSNYGPDLEFYNNKFFLAWSDKDETFQQIYIMEGAPTSSGTINWGKKCRYDATKHRPALFNGFGDLMLGWRAWYTQGRFFYCEKINDSAGGTGGYGHVCDGDFAQIQTLDFRPVDGNYDINWPGPPRRAITYGDCEHYVVDIQLDRDAPCDFSRTFKITEKRWWGWDTLGQFTASFTEGSGVPTISYSRQCCGASAYPSGAPSSLTDGTFWIGCTKKGKIKANGEKGDDGHALIGLDKVNKDDGIGVSGYNFSPQHDVNCR